MTCFPSTTHFCLALGADSPCADERCAGNLGLTARGPFTPFIATHVSIRTSDTSSNPYESPSQAYGTLSYHQQAPLNALMPAALARRRLMVNHHGEYLALDLAALPSAAARIKGNALNGA